MSHNINIEYDNEAALNETTGVISEGSYSMPFLLRKGEKNTKKRLLVILHGHGANKAFAKFQQDDWDVLCPLDTFGTEGYGCWWLGESGNLFVYRLLHSLIEKMKLSLDTKELYFWGSSMGGFGAILHGILLKADAIYAHMPQVKLVGTDYTDGANAKYYEPMRNANSADYLDLVSFIGRQPNSSGPVLFLSQNVFDYPNYIQQHFFPLIDILDRKKFAYKVDMNLKKGHVLYEKIYQSVQNFEIFSDEICNWRQNQDIENIEEIAKLNLLNILKKEIKLEFIFDKHILSISFTPLNSKFSYACYLYDNDQLLHKSGYQKNGVFKFLLEDIQTSSLSVKFYLMDSSNNQRISKIYLVM